MDARITKPVAASHRNSPPFSRRHSPIGARGSERCRSRSGTARTSPSCWRRMPISFRPSAKFRALRRPLGARRGSGGAGARPIRLHGENAWRMTTQRDPLGQPSCAHTVATVLLEEIGGRRLPYRPLHRDRAHACRSLARARGPAYSRMFSCTRSNLWRVVDPADGAGGYVGPEREGHVRNRRGAAFQADRIGKAGSVGSLDFQRLAGAHR